MFRKISTWLLKMMGWEIRGAIPPGSKKAVIIAAPHTSMWDFVIGRLAYGEIGVKVKFLIKKEIFFFPLGPLLKWLGGIPVDRSKNTNLVHQVVEWYEKSDSLFVVITPEGTRKPTTRWKRGFYYIAERANLPIALAYMDYAKKEGGIGPVIQPSGDINADMEKIKRFYMGITAKHPERFTTGLEDN
jgi:1-acyl-sn-glycerol-3-phosphate acyltransferase